MLLLIVTLGIAYPNVIQRNMAFTAKHIYLEGGLDSSEITQSDQERGKTGEGLDGALGLDSGFMYAHMSSTHMIDARYFDGVTAIPREVRLEIQPMRLIGKSPQGQLMFQWQWNEILLRHPPDVTQQAELTHRSYPDMQLYLTASSFARIQPYIH